MVVHFAGADKFIAGDIAKYVNGFQVLNPDLVIFNCDSSVRIKMELTIEKGRGYVPARKTNRTALQTERSLSTQFTRQ